MKRGLSLLSLFIVVVAAIGGAAHYFSGPSEPQTEGGEATVRRLSEVQYTRSIESIFGAGLEIPGRFDPPRREDGLLAVGNSRVVVSRSGFEQAELRAREIAAAVLAEDRREQTMPCTPAAGAVFDEACAAEFVSAYGKQLYRRVLTAEEQSSIMQLAQLGAEQSGDFYLGLEAGLSRMLLSPNFLYRVETAADVDQGDKVSSLDQFSLASRISFLLWDAPPDSELLALAEAGELDRSVVLEQQVERMIASPRFEQGVRAFFSDMYGFDEFEGLTKEQQLFPAFSTRLKEDAEEQVLRTLVDLLVTNSADYRDVFTTRKTFLNRRLSAIYQVPAPVEALDGWAPYEFSPDSNRRGVLTLAAFLMLDPTHEGRTSPTIRGQVVREKYLCQKVPPPPPAVDFQLVQDTENPEFRTARERLSVHATNPTCAGCHAITDPIGLALENYDAIGVFRVTENGAPIDASGSFEGTDFSDAVEFQHVLRNSESAASCLVKRVYEYGVGRPVNAGEHEWMAYLNQEFSTSGYALAPLMRAVVLSQAFRAIAVPDAPSLSESVALTQR